MRDRDRRRLKKLWERRSPEAIAAELGVAVGDVLKEARRQRLPLPDDRPAAASPVARRTRLALLLLTLGVYANNLPNVFVNDDYPAIVENPAARDLSQTVRIFTTASWWKPRADAAHYRPLTTFTFALNGSLTGHEPGAYHLVNNLLHGVAAIVLHEVLLRSGAGPAAALLTSVLFVVHPLHVEAVSWVNGRADVLAGLFVLLALLAHLRGRQEGSSRWRVVAVVSFLAAGLAKETGYVTPFVLLAWDLLLGGDGPWQRRLGETLQHGWLEYLGHAAVLGFFAWARIHFVGGATATTVTPMASPLAADPGFLDRLFTGSYVLARYLGLTLWPGPLSNDYSPDQITKLTSLADPRAVLGLVVLAGWFAAIAKTASRAPRTAFWMAAAAIVMAPAANILFPIGTIQADRLMYLPLLGIVAPLAEAWGTWHARQPQAARAVAAMVVIALTARTVSRTADWRTDERLYRSALAASPRSAMAHKNLAAVLQDQGRNEEAAALAKTAVDTVPTFPDAWLTLGSAYVGLGRNRDAIAAYRRVIALRSDHPSAHTNLAAALFFEGDTEGALRESLLGLQCDVDQPIGWYNRVHFLVAAGRLAEAEQTLAEAVRRYPDYGARPQAEERLRQASGASTANP